MAESPLQVLAGRDVPLGGLRALDVRRTLPHRDRSFIGAWCFVDHYGPTPITSDGREGMDLPPHPHTGLQTVSYLFAGALEHRDSTGAHALVRPGEVNLMTSGYGISHSEVSTPDTDVLHGVQLWTALPDADRNGPPRFEHHEPEARPIDGGTARVFIGRMQGVDESPIRVSTPLLGAELNLDPDTEVRLAVDPAYEHGLLIDSGTVTCEGTTLAPADLGCLEPGRSELVLRTGPEPVRAVLIGGAPFEEEIVMWWNFIGRSHDEVAAAREEWQAAAARFGQVEGYVGEVSRIPAPEIPPVRLRPRSRRGTVGRPA